MPIFNLENKKKILFIHIPKTGGTSIECSFSNVCSSTLLYYDEGPIHFLKCSPQHLTLEDLKILGHDINSFDYSFAIVRNPYKRLESEYFYNIHLENQSIDFKKCIINSVNQDKIQVDFSEWIIENLKKYKENKYHNDNHFIPQCEFFDDSIDRVFVFENGMDKILNELSIKIGIELPIEHRYKTDKFPIEWSKEAVNLVNDIYENDFKKFNYEKM